MKKFRSALFLFLVTALVVGIMPNFKAKAESNEMLNIPASMSNDTVGENVFEIDGEKYVYSYDFTDPAVNKAKVTEENGAVTKFEYNNETNTLYKNGEVDFNLTMEEDGVFSSSNMSTMKIPPGGKYMGKYNYKYNLKGVSVGVAATAISTITKTPYNVVFAIVGFLAGTQTTAYYTVFQYRYAFKCSAYPYANRTKFYEDSKRKKVLKTADSPKFFGSRPIPSTCRP
ncbi:hypothetical protein [Bacillus sp. JK62]